MSILLQLSMLVVGANANNICKDLYEEFVLEDGYNKNLVPPVNLVVTDKQKIHDIEEVNNAKSLMILIIMI